MYIVAWLTNTPPLGYTFQEYIAELQGNFSYVPISILIGTVIGGIPALLFGGVSGAVIGGLLSHPTIAHDSKTRIAAGSIFGGIIVMLVHVIGYTTQPPDYRNPIMYGLALGIPSVVYMGICVWVSYKIEALVKRATTYA